MRTHCCLWCFKSSLGGGVVLKTERHAARHPWHLVALQPSQSRVLSSFLKLVLTWTTDGIQESSWSEWWRATTPSVTVHAASVCHGMLCWHRAGIIVGTSSMSDVSKLTGSVQTLMSLVIEKFSGYSQRLSQAYTCKQVNCKWLNTLSCCACWPVFLSSYIKPYY